jgi:hypothetical protein
MLTANDLSLRRCTFEMRYDPTYLLWDRAGNLWTQVLTAYPEAKPFGEVRPNMAQFTNGDNLFSADLGKAYVIADKKNVERNAFVQTAATFADIVMNVLEINETTRLSFRAQFERRTKDAKEAIELLTQVLSPNLESPISLTDLRIERLDETRQWKSKAADLTVRLRTEEQHLQVSPNFGLPEEISRVLHFDDHRHYVIADIDYAVTARASRGKLNFAEWIRQGWTIVHDGLPKLLASRTTT